MNLVDVVLLTLILTTAMFCLSCAVATFDIIVVWFGVWIPLRRATAPEDRPYLWMGVAGYARAAREAHEADERMREAERLRHAW